MKNSKKENDLIRFCQLVNLKYLNIETEIEELYDFLIKNYEKNS